MNLRKLLCGLLALCLLLTMAPAALMEEAIEAPVGEVVEELGEVAQGEDYTVIVPSDDDPVNPIKDAQITMKLGQTRTLTYDYKVDDVSTDKLGIASFAKNGNQLKVTAESDGETIVTVTLITDSPTQAKIKAIINLTVKGNNKPGKINMFNNDGYNMTGETVTHDLSDASFELNTRVYAKDNTLLTYGVDYNRVIWSSSKPAVANVEQIKTDDIITDPEHVKVVLKKAGTTKITATVKGTAVKCSITLKVTEKHKPTKVSIEDCENEVNGVNLYQTLTNGDHIYPINNGPLDMYAVVDPADYEYDVTWTVSNTKLAFFRKDNKATGKPVKSIKGTYGNVAKPIHLYINDTNKTGTVTVTAQVYNGKKATLKIKLIKLDSIKSLKIYDTIGNRIDGKKITRPLSYIDTEFSDYDLGGGDLVSAQGREFWVKGVLENYLGDAIDPDKADIKWTSSNKKVATVSKWAYDPNGAWAKIKLLKKGKTTITMKVTSGTGLKKTKSFVLTVDDPFEPVAIYFVDEDNIEIKSITLKKGQQASVNIMAEYLTSEQPDAMMSYNQLKFSTSDKHHATVSSNGIITAVKKGSAVIKVKTYNGLTKSLKVIVK